MSQKNSKADEYEPCVDCRQTGFADKVFRGAWAMEPREKICPICAGRGWVRRKQEDDYGSR